VLESGFSQKSTTDPYYTIVVARSASGIYNHNFPLPKLDAQVYLLEHDVQALELIWGSTARILKYIDQILDIGTDILLHPRKHDQLLFDDDSFSRSRKYWWVSNLLVPLRQNIEASRKVHQQFFDNLITPIIGITAGSGAPRDTSTWPNGLENFEGRATRAYNELEKLLDRMDVQQKRVNTLRDGVSTYSKVFCSCTCL
jgi:hypothetical protein